MFKITYDKHNLFFLKKKETFSMTEYTFGQTRAALEILKQNIEILKDEINAKQQKEEVQSVNEASLSDVDVGILKEKLAQTLQKIDEATAMIDEVIK